MDAIDYLRRQHHEMERAMAQVLEADADGMRSRFVEVADQLTMHIESEEQVFYPAVKAERTEDILLESLEEHLSLKRLLAMIELPLAAPTFAAKFQVLKEQTEHHHKEEEEHLFPKVMMLLDADARTALGRKMEALQQRLQRQGDPREAVADQTDEAAPLT